MLQSNEEELVMKFIHLPMVRHVLNHDLVKIKQAGLKFEYPYVSFIENKIFQVGKDLGQIIREMVKLKIKVYDKGIRDREGLPLCQYLIVCRGYHQEMNIFSHVMKGNVGELVSEYIIEK